jgi:NADPH:quinone reductase-like Zn-dependent oxidoreductase
MSEHQTMRAVLIKDGKGPASALYLGDAPAATPGTVLVKVKTFGLNRMDTLQRDGHYPGSYSPLSPHDRYVLMRS